MRRAREARAVAVAVVPIDGCDESEGESCTVERLFCSHLAQAFIVGTRVAGADRQCRRRQRLAVV